MSRASTVGATRPATPRATPRRSHRSSKSGDTHGTNARSSRSSKKRARHHKGSRSNSKIKRYKKRRSRTLDCASSEGSEAQLTFHDNHARTHESANSEESPRELDSADSADSRRSSYEGVAEQIMLPELDDDAREYGFVNSALGGLGDDGYVYHQPVPLRLRQSFSEDHTAHETRRRPRPPAPRISLGYGARDSDDNAEAVGAVHARQPPRRGHKRRSTETSLSSAQLSAVKRSAERVDRERYVTPPSVTSGGGSTKQIKLARDELRLRNAISDSDDILFIARNNRAHSDRSRSRAKWQDVHLPMFGIEEGVIEYHVPSTRSGRDVQSRQSRQSGRERKQKQNIKINIHINNDVLNKCRSLGGGQTLTLDSVESLSEDENSEGSGDSGCYDSPDSGDSVERHVGIRPKTCRAGMARSGSGRKMSPMRLKGSESLCLRSRESKHNVPPIELAKASSMTDLHSGRARKKREKKRRRKGAGRENVKVKVRSRDKDGKVKVKSRVRTGRTGRTGRTSRVKCKHGRRHKGDRGCREERDAKRGCSCHKHAKEIKREKTSKKVKVKKAKGKMKKGKEKVKQIKFRKKFRNPVPPPVAVSPRSARLTRENSLQSHDWSGLV